MYKRQVLDSFERLDQVAVADRVANPQPGQRTRLGKGVHDEQVRMAIDQRNRRVVARLVATLGATLITSFAAEVHVLSLIHI